VSQILKPIVDVLLQVLIFFNRYVQSWGWSIIALTVVVKIVLLPLAIKQTKAMESMKKWQPEMKKLQEKYKNDKEKLGQEMMKFYGENKINPFGGCLPLLLQMPIFFALFRLLGYKTSPIFNELSKSKFLGLSSLTGSLRSCLGSEAGIGCLIPFIVLLLLMLISQYGMQKMMSTDPQQDKMMIPMIIFMAVIAVGLPAGVLLYWVIFNILSVGQHYLIIKLMTAKDSLPVGKNS